MQTARLWMLALVCVIGCSVSASAQKPKPKAADDDRDPATDRAITRFLASPRFAAVREAERLEALPVERLDKNTFNVVERPVALDDATMREIREKVTKTRSYYGGMTACMFEPGLALRFHKGRDSVTMLACLLCHEVLFRDASGRMIGRKLLFDEDVMHLLPLARKAFPDHPEFQHMPGMP